MRERVTKEGGEKWKRSIYIERGGEKEESEVCFEGGYEIYIYIEGEIGEVCFGGECEGERYIERGRKNRSVCFGEYERDRKGRGGVRGRGVREACCDEDGGVSVVGRHVYWGGVVVGLY
jgi:hypothetical protein